MATNPIQVQSSSNPNTTEGYGFDQQSMGTGVAAVGSSEAMNNVTIPNTTEGYGFDQQPIGIGVAALGSSEALNNVTNPSTTEDGFIQQPMGVLAAESGGALNNMNPVPVQTSDNLRMNQDTAKNEIANTGSDTKNIPPTMSMGYSFGQSTVGST